MAKIKKTSSAQKKGNSLSVINPAAAGIDIGDKIHAVAVPPDGCDDPVRTFGTMTCDLQVSICYSALACPIGHNNVA